MDSPYKPLEFSLLNEWQRDLPITAQPFLHIARQAGVEETTVLQTLRKLASRGAISRVGAVFAPRRVGASTLAALSAPLDRLESIADQISARPEVNHNYQRDHQYNLWFVATAAHPQELAESLAGIQQETGCKVLAMPLEQEYHIDLGFDLKTPVKHHSLVSDGPLHEPDEDEKRLIIALQPGLELVSRPFARLAERAGMSEQTAMAHIEAWLADGMIKRFGVVVRHHELGYRANAMVVFDLPDDRVDGIGRQLAREAGVTLCYRRRRSLPDWPYNLYCMVHGRSREEVLPTVAQLSRLAGQEGLPLFSTRRFKQCGARYFSEPAHAPTMRKVAVLDETDKRIINALQEGFPLCDEPYRAAAEGLGLPEAELIQRLDSMLERRVLTRFGPLFQIERMGGAFVLAALKVPEADFERVAEQVNALPEVAHNYRREHALNMWFVLATETPGGIAAAIEKIEAVTGLPVFAFPKEREFFVELKLRA